MELADREILNIFQILTPGEGRIPATDIVAYCKEVEIDENTIDTERVIRLVKFTEGTILHIQAEEREKRSKK